MKLIVLDMDDTLYLERDYVRSGFKAVGALVSKKYGIDDPSNWLWQQFEAGVRGNTFDLLIKQYGLPTAVIGELVTAYRDHKPSIELEGDAREFLHHWHGRAPLALVTDGYFPGQRSKVEALGIAPFFDEVVLTDERGPEWSKPSPRSFAYLQEHFGAAADECVYIGDNPHKDFHGPRELG